MRNRKVIQSLPNSSRLSKGLWMIRGLTVFLVLLGLLAVVRRSYVMFYPLDDPLRSATRVISSAGFSEHRVLTLLHILPAGVFMVLMPFQFVERVRVRHLAWHRWTGRLLVVLGVVVGMSAF